MPLASVRGRVPYLGGLWSDLIQLVDWGGVLGIPPVVGIVLGPEEAAFPGGEMLLIFVGFGVGIWTRSLESWGGRLSRLVPTPPANRFYAAGSCIPGMICLGALKFEF